MRNDLLALLRDPVTQQPLRQFAFVFADSPANTDVAFGVLQDEQSKMVYPILAGVPQLLPNSVPPEFAHRFADEIRESVGSLPADMFAQSDVKWSFSAEWDAFFNKGVEKTWGWDISDRLEMFLLETQLSAKELAGAIILDAGCGNGLLSEALTSFGATVFAIDYSTSVFGAEKRRRSPSVHFVRGDLANPPFEAETFDVVYSSGVLHHTPDTKATFMRVARLTRPGGRFYVWLYRRSKQLRHRLMHFREDVVRPVCSRLPAPLRDAIVHADAGLLWGLTRLLRAKTRASYDEHVVASYDLLSPKFAWHHHTPYEVSSWFLESGYSSPNLTHWDNPNGFGMVAVKVPLRDTPGVNYGRRGDVSRQYA